MSKSNSKIQMHIEQHQNQTFDVSNKNQNGVNLKLSLYAANPVKPQIRQLKTSN